MQLIILFTSFMAAAVSARRFTLYENANYGGAAHTENRYNDDACWNLNGKGDRASSVRGDGTCTTFFRERDCKGSNWVQVGDAPTVPAFLNDHIWSFRNKCNGCPNPFSPCQYVEDDGTCSFGYAACLQKMGCGNRAGELDCAGHAAGCAIACG